MREPRKIKFDHHANNRLSLWKRENKRLFVTKIIRLFLLSVLLLALVNLSLKIPSFIDNVNKPFEKIQSNIIKGSSVNDKYRTNIMIVSLSERDSLQDVVLASFSSNKKSLSILRVPVATKIYTFGSDQYISLGAAYFSKVYQDSSLDSLLSITKETLALPIDGYFVFNQTGLEFDDGQVKEVKNKIFSPSFFFGFLGLKKWLDTNMKTGYSVKEIANLSWSYKQMSPERIVFLDLEESAEDKKISFQKGDTLIKEQSLDSSIANEKGVVEIVHSTEEEYFGQVVERLVNNLGASTVNLGKVGKNSVTRVILGSNKNFVAERVAKFLNTEVEKEDLEGGVDVRVIIGEDFSEKFYGK
ncbi:MAG: LytR C-terminal domain-containing protein [Candidatus Woykebacteria bacterium]